MCPAACEATAAVGFGYSCTCSSICWTQRSFTFGSIFFGMTTSSRTHKEAASNLGRFTLDYGYALTLHKAQGRTVQTGLLWGDPSMYLEAGYVGLSRGRSANHLYLTPNHDHSDDTAGCVPHPRPRPDPADRSRGLATSRAHQLALHQLSPDTSHGRSR